MHAAIKAISHIGGQHGQESEEGEEGEEGEERSEEDCEEDPQGRKEEVTSLLKLPASDSRHVISAFEVLVDDRGCRRDIRSTVGSFSFTVRQKKRVFFVRCGYPF